MPKFVVHKTNLLDPKTGKKVGDGEVIELEDNKVIRKFNKKGFLRPYIEDVEDEDDEDDDDDDTGDPASSGAGASGAPASPKVATKATQEHG